MLQNVDIEEYSLVLPALIKLKSCALEPDNQKKF